MILTVASCCLKSFLSGGQIHSGVEILLMILTMASCFLDLILPVLIEVGRREKDEVSPTCRPRRGEDILLMILTVAFCCLKAVLPGFQVEARRSS
jgi:hypothetical protein